MAQARPVDEKRTEALEPLKLNAKKRGAKAPKRRTRKSRVTATRSRTKPADKLTKQQTCLDLLGRQEGATIEELQAGDWLAATQRARLPGRRRQEEARSYALSEKPDARPRHYRISDAR